MTKFTKLMGATALCVVGATTAYADGHACALDGGRVSILSNDFAAVNAIAAAAAECTGAEVTANQTTEHRDIQVAALTANPAEYTVAVVANSSIVALLNDGLIRPLDDLIAAVHPLQGEDLAHVYVGIEPALLQALVKSFGMFAQLQKALQLLVSACTLSLSE